MSLRDRPPQNLRPRWPAEFDIEGIPRDPAIRKQVLIERNSIPEEKVMPQNEFDINKPHKEPYQHQDYPRRLYKGAEGLTVNSAEDEEKAIANGYARKADAEKLQASRAKENKEPKPELVEQEEGFGDPAADANPVSDAPARRKR